MHPHTRINPHQPLAGVFYSMCEPMRTKARTTIEDNTKDRLFSHLNAWRFYQNFAGLSIALSPIPF